MCKIIPKKFLIHLRFVDSIKVFDCGNPTSNLSIMNIQYKSGTAPATTIYRTSAILACPVGYFWIDAAVIKNISCQANGRWSPVPPCIGINFASCIKYSGLDYDCRVS